MLTYIENLRKKPERQRRKAVLLISVGFTLFIIIIWGITLGMRFSNTDFSFDGKSPTVVADVPSLRETFSNFSDQVSRILNSAGATSTTGITTK